MDGYGIDFTIAVILSVFRPQARFVESGPQTAGAESRKGSVDFASGTSVVDLLVVILERPPTARVADIVGELSVAK